LPDPRHGGRRRASAWKLVAAFAAGALIAGIAVALLVGQGRSTTPKPTPTVGSSSDIAMADATGASCRPPVAPGPGHPSTLLSELFNVHAGSTAYLLGWQVLPFSGDGRTYRFGSAGNLLALEPPTGGTPVGYGKGTVTVGSSPEVGTIDATVTLKSGKTLAVQGAWSCTVPTTPSSTVVSPTIPVG
jgi:hypothetical protein